MVTGTLKKAYRATPTRWAFAIPSYPFFASSASNASGRASAPAVMVCASSGHGEPSMPAFLSPRHSCSVYASTASSIFTISATVRGYLSFPPASLTADSRSVTTSAMSVRCSAQTWSPTWLQMAVSAVVAVVTLGPHSADSVALVGLGLGLSLLLLVQAVAAARSSAAASVMVACLDRVVPPLLVRLRVDQRRVGG